jgi:hypothetical protein
VLTTGWRVNFSFHFSVEPFDSGDLASKFVSCLTPKRGVIDVDPDCLPANPVCLQFTGCDQPPEARLTDAQFVGCSGVSSRGQDRLIAMRAAPVTCLGQTNREMIRKSHDSQSTTPLKFLVFRQLRG